MGNKKVFNKQHYHNRKNIIINEQLKTHIYNEQIHITERSLSW